ncbi:MAG: ROK family transcriptional regulator [Spirochaetes bacterium]|nr:ROK family transcriptional regulator [Spirochaetota bacterium]
MGDKSYLNRKNIIDILLTLQRKNPISRAEIARLSNLTPATVSRVVTELLKRKILRERGPGVSIGGRRPVLIEFNPEAFYLAGIDLGITKVTGVIIDLHGNILSKAKLDIDVSEGKDRIIEWMLTVTKKALSSTSRLIRSKLTGIGVSLSGIIDTNKGLSVFSPSIPNWHNVPIVQLFQNEFHLPVFIENDARAMALAEARYGAGRNYDNFFCINIGHGIGSGIIINKELYRGKTSTAGEFGHMTLVPSGPLCHCGNRGCVEVMAGGHAITASAIRVASSGGNTLIKELVEGDIKKINAEVVALAAKKGDDIALRLLNEVGRYLGIAIANIINLLNPELIVIGGGVSNAGEFFFEEIKNVIKKRAFTTMVNNPEIVTSALGDDASSIGAAALVLSEIISTKGLLNV